MVLLEQFTDFYQRLDQTSLKSLPELYSDNIEFIDPVTQHHGMGQLHNYFARLLDGCTSCEFIIRHTQAHHDTGYVEWTMRFSHPRLRQNRPIDVDGVSVICVANGKIIRQRDYYDMGSMLYENIPVIGTVVRWLRTRLAA